MIWKIRVKKGLGGVSETCIETLEDDFGHAQAKAIEYCDSQPGWRFVGMERFLVWSEVEDKKQGKAIKKTEPVLPQRVGA